MTAKWKWLCAKKGHQPLTEGHLDKILVGEKYLIGNICVHCGSLYYFPNGETQGSIIALG